MYENQPELLRSSFGARNYLHQLQARLPERNIDTYQCLEEILSKFRTKEVCV
jgi:hypothetical protein